MKVGTKLSIGLVVPIVVLIAAFGMLDEHRSRQRYRDELRREGRAVARSVQLAMEDALRDRQLQDVEKLVDQITGFERVLGIRLFDPDGSLRYQSDPLRAEPFLATEALGQVLAGRRPAETQRLIDGQRVLTYILPLESPSGDLLGAVQLLQLESFIDEEARATRNAILALTVVLIVVTGLTVILVTRFVVSRPVEGFIGSIRTFQPGGGRARLPLRGGDELERLATEFNALWDRLDASHRSLVKEQEERRQAEDRLRNAERLAALGQLAAGLAHEIGTPLNVISGRAERLGRKGSGDGETVDREALRRDLRIITEQIERITRIVREMVEFARIKEPRLARTAVPEVLAGVLEFTEQRLDESGIRRETDLPGTLPPVLGDRDQLYEVFLNLVLNAADAMNRGDVLRVAAEPVRRAHPETGGEPREYLAVRVQDSGTGIAPEDLERVFDPFFTTKGVGRGSGLGMSVAYGIVREHDGWIDVESRVGEGTRVTVYLPTAPVSAAPEALAGRTG